MRKLAIEWRAMNSHRLILKCSVFISAMRILLFVNLNLETSKGYISVTDCRQDLLVTNQSNWRQQCFHQMGFTNLKGSPCVGYQADSSKLRSYQAGCYISLVQSDRLLHFFGSIRQIVAYRYDWIRQILTYFEQGYIIWANRASCNIPRSPPRSETLTSVVPAGETTMPVSQVCNSFISHQISSIVLTRCLPFCSTEPTYLTLL